MLVQIKNFMKENIKEVVGYEGLYEVTESGEIIGIERTVKNKNGIRVVRPKTISQRNNGFGYLISPLSKNGKLKLEKVSRIVASAFIPNPTNLPCVNHIDGNKLNNNLKNLEWCSVGHNMKHSYDIGLRKSKKGSTYKQKQN